MVVVGLVVPRTTAGRVGPALWCPVQLGSAGGAAAAKLAAPHQPITKPCFPLDSRSYLLDAPAAQIFRIPAMNALPAASWVPPRARPAVLR